MIVKAEYGDWQEGDYVAYVRDSDNEIHRVIFSQKELRRVPKQLKLHCLGRILVVRRIIKGDLRDVVTPAILSNL